MRSAWVVVVALVLGTGIASRADSIGDIKAGNAALARGDADSAIALYTKALGADELSVENRVLAHENRCNAYRAIEAYELALADCKTAIQLGPEEAFAYLQQCIIYNTLSDFDAAISNCATASRIRPDNIDAHIYGCAAFGNKGDFPRASAECDAALRLNPADTTALENRGWIEFATENFGAAARTLRGAPEVFRGLHRDIWIFLARMRAGDSEAPNDLRKAPPVTDPWSVTLADFLLGNVPQAELRARAQSGDMNREKGCDAIFVIAEQHLGQNSDLARPLLEEIVRDCTEFRISEQVVAAAELQRLDRAK